MRHQRAHRRMARLAGEGRGDLAAPPGELGRRDARVGDLVGDVVDLAAEGVEGGDRGAPRRRQEEEGVVEARAAGGRLLLDVLLGRHAARAGAGDRAAGAWRARARRATGASAPAERRPRDQRGTAEPLDPLEHAQAALDDEAQLPARAAARRRGRAARRRSISSRVQATSSSDEAAQARRCRGAPARRRDRRRAGAQSASGT